MKSILEYRLYTLGDFLTDCYLVFRDKDALLIDPAIPDQSIADYIEQNGLSLRFILNTHGHIDHIGGNRFFKDRYPEAQLIIHENDVRYLTDPSLNLSSEINRPFTSPVPDDVLRQKTGQFHLDELPIDYYHTPGHTPGSVCWYFPDRQWLFSGDTLFAGSVGRTDLPGGSFQALVQSLQIFSHQFPASSTVFPGHGPHSTLQEEVETNPYLLEYGKGSR